MRTDLQMKSTLEHEKPCPVRSLPGQLVSENIPAAMRIHNLSTFSHHDSHHIHNCMTNINTLDIFSGALRRIRETMNQPDRHLSSFPPGAAPFEFPGRSTSPSSSSIPA